MKVFLKIFRYLRKNFQKQHLSSSYEEVERSEQIFYLNYLRDGMTVFDVGANVGELTLLFTRFVGLSGRVHSFEASGETFRKLKIICDAAGRPNAELNHLAVSDKNEIIRLNIYEDAYSSFNSQAARPLKDYGLDFEPVGFEEIAATTIDDYCEKNNVEKIDLLKIDVEGAELQVMRGARRMLKSKKIECLTFEFGQTTFDMGNTPEEIEEFLTEMDYEISNIVENDPLFPGREKVQTARFAMHVAVPKANV